MVTMDTPYINRKCRLTNRIGVVVDGTAVAKPALVVVVHNLQQGAQT